MPYLCLTVPYSIEMCLCGRVALHCRVAPLDHWCRDFSRDRDLEGFSSRRRKSSCIKKKRKESGELRGAGALNSSERDSASFGSVCLAIRLHFNGVVETRKRTHKKEEARSTETKEETEEDKRS